MTLAQQVQTELTNITDFACEVTTLECGTVVITLPREDASESRWVMQAFCTETLRARRRPRSFREIEVKIRN